MCRISPTKFHQNSKESRFGEDGLKHLGYNNAIIQIAERYKFRENKKNNSEFYTVHEISQKKLMGYSDLSMTMIKSLKRLIIHHNALKQKEKRKRKKKVKGKRASNGG